MSIWTIATHRIEWTNTYGERMGAIDAVYYDSDATAIADFRRFIADASPLTARLSALDDNGKLERRTIRTYDRDAGERDPHRSSTGRRGR